MKTVIQTLELFCDAEDNAKKNKNIRETRANDADVKRLMCEAKASLREFETFQNESLFSWEVSLPFTYLLKGFDRNA